MLVNNYDFVEWYKLNLETRVDLITVIEGVRHGAKIELWRLKKRGLKYFSQQKVCLKYCLKKFGLKYKEHKADYYISKDETLLKQLSRKEIKIGEFLGYPRCCIDAFEKGCQQAALAKDDSKGPAVEFSRKMTLAFDNGTFNPILLYIFYIPCDLNCKESIRKATKTMAILKSKDIEAARYLEEHNKNMVYKFHYYYLSDRRR